MSVNKACIVLALAGLHAGTLPVAAQISDEVVKLGVLSDMSSLYSDATGKGSLIAAQMAATDFGGRVAGKPIEIIGGDHQNKPDVGASIAREWYDTRKVDAIIDVPTSSVAIAVQQITKEKDRVFLISGAGASDLTGRFCSPNGIHWTYDTYALSNVAGKAIVAHGDDTWFFVTVDYAFGYALEHDASAVVQNSGGKVLGAARAPLNAQDFSAFLLQAQGSKAKVVGLANAGDDTQNAIKQAYEFGLQKGGQKLAALLFNITDAHALGLRDRARSAGHRRVLLGYERRNACVLEPLSRQGRAHADDDTGWGRFGRDPLPQSRRSHRDRCGEAHPRQNEGNAGQ